MVLPYLETTFNPYFIIMDNSREIGHSNAIVHCATNDTEADGE